LILEEKGFKSGELKVSKNYHFSASISIKYIPLINFYSFSFYYKKILRKNRKTIDIPLINNTEMKKRAENLILSFQKWIY
jgi:hypothetical protein